MSLTELKSGPRCSATVRNFIRLRAAFGGEYLTNCRVQYTEFSGVYRMMRPVYERKEVVMSKTTCEMAGEEEKMYNGKLTTEGGKDREGDRDMASFEEDVASTIELYKKAVGGFAPNTERILRNPDKINTISNLMKSGDIQKGFKVLRDTHN
jgi:hypothetical protein